jgi:hypothetical protein
MDAAGNPA